MIEIAFLTTNNVKLAHARHLCQDWDVNIIQHKLLHYGIGYEEPRLFERKKLLEESVKDAIQRWEKNISKAENRLYFIEDTSVIIHALSTSDNEVPGVDIKYWMRENTFEKVDKELRNKGNNRRVTIYSHIVLVLTKDLKEKFGQDNITFKGKSDGFFVESEYKFDTNKLYPWLDNVSFNKWFVPPDESIPISMFPIEKADVYDFRKDSFTQMLNFLFEQNKIHKKSSKEIDSRFIFNPLFVISGPTCAGKSTIGKFLLENYEYYHIEASDFMTVEFIETHGHKTKIDIGEFAKEILKVKPHIVVDNIFKYLENIPYVNSMVVTGFRTPDEIEYFMKFSPLRGKFVLVFVNTDYEIRYNRWVKRNIYINETNRTKFDKSNTLQREMGVEKITELDKISIIENNRTFDDYYNLFQDSFLEELKMNSILELFDIPNITPKNLEDAILMTLAVDFKVNSQKYYTTTEISHKINQTFISLTEEKHKDNVSRYFNQKIYPYYEVKTILDKIKYKLSPTGYSKTIFLLKQNYLKT